MSVLTVWHNPRCSKSRAVLSLLEARGVAVTVVDYLKTPITAVQLDRVLRTLDLPCEAVFRTTEKLYQDMNLAYQSCNRQQWLELICNHPILMQRPIVFSDERAVIGRLPEAVLEII